MNKQQYLKSRIRRHNILAWISGLALLTAIVLGVLLPMDTGDKVVIFGIFDLVLFINWVIHLNMVEKYLDEIERYEYYIY